ncbi:hypothetical protein MVEN_00197400 [Mycena venus]|uniref:DUF6534 domain-containing protein n=1 Tax=Mycena venus TaxID=2733690 RepID=A0A8H7DD99_9AGAR|nr:hypothetical protein MVEN_00197400 [Mycena venus]
MDDPASDYHMEDHQINIDAVRTRLSSPIDVLFLPSSLGDQCRGPGGCPTDLFKTARDMSVTEGNAYLLAGSWLNCMLFMLEIFLVFRYFQLPSKPLLHRIGIAAIIFFRPSLQTLALILFATYGTASIEQLFFCYLYFNLTKRRILSGFLVFSVAVHLAFSYSSGALILANNTAQGSSFLTSKMGAIACAATDIMIATALVHTFARFEKTMTVRVSTQILLRRLMVFVFTSGVVVASVTSLEMVFLLRGIPAYSLFFYCQGRVYALTLLCNSLWGMPGQFTPSVNSDSGSVVTGVVFHSDYNDPTSRRNYDDRRHSEPTDMGLDRFAFLPSKSQAGLRLKRNIHGQAVRREDPTALGTTR